MRSVTTQHIYDARVGHEGLAIRRALNVAYLLTLLQYTDSTSRDDRGKKRALSSEPTPLDRRRKRFKKADATDDSKGVQADDDIAEEKLSSVAVYKHTFDIRYIWNEDAEGDWTDAKKLVKWLKQKQQNGWSTGINGIHLTPIGPSLSVFDSSSALLEVPGVEPSFSIEDHDVRHLHVRDPLVACAVLEEAGRTELSTSLRVHVDPVADQLAPSLRIALEVTVSLVLPAVAEPIMYTTKTATSEIEEAQRRALRYIFPPVVHHRAPSTHLDVATLYATIGPAPRLDSSLEANFQPINLLPTLLPFQRRSAAWLLSREHRTINDRHDVVDRRAPDFELPLFWQKVSVEAPQNTERRLYVNDITGEVSVNKPDSGDPLGGILAEEPGLGKTLESIALILLNPAVSRNPSVKAWNPDARIYMKEVKVHCVCCCHGLAR